MTDLSDLIRLKADIQERLSRQSYGAAGSIADVQIVDLPVFSDEGGDFAEITRFTPEGTLAALPSYRPAQISYSLLEPGTIKAWHLHLRQDDLWFVPPAGRLVVGLLDVREDSPTCGLSRRLALGAPRPRLLLIPAGVAHGIANVGTAAATLIYFATTGFDPADPDELRLPFDLLDAEFWRIKPG